MNKNGLINNIGFYYLIHEYINSVTRKEIEKTLKHSSIEGFAKILGRNLALRIMGNKMKLIRTRVDKIKFLVSDIWTSLFGKIVDKLETNNSGTYIITTENFHLLNKISSTNTQEIKNYVSYFKVFFKAFIKSIMRVFKINSTVTVNTDNYKKFVFNVLML